MKKNEQPFELTEAVIEKIMNRATEISGYVQQECFDFCIMTSHLKPGVLILRWTSVDLSNPDFPCQTFHYECFEEDGTPQNCSIYFDQSRQQEANEFFFSLVKLHSQDFCHQ